MTNNLEDFEQPDFEPGGGGPQASGVRANLAHAWRTRPLFKLLVLMIVVGAVIAVGINLFSSAPPGSKTQFAQPPMGVKQAPGGPASPYFKQETEMATKERETAALATNGSALPTPIGQNNSVDELTETDRQKKDPLIELRNQIAQEHQEITRLEQKNQQPATPAVQSKPEQFDDSLAQAMQKQMEQLMTGWEPHGIKQVAVTKEDEESGDKSGKKPGASFGSEASGGSSAALTAPRVVVPAGTVSYAQLLTEANSDVPGPILAQIVSGPLSGARAVGEFKVMSDYLVLKFSLANLKGKDYAISALALDPDTTLGGMATEVDERYFTRVLLPAAAGFMQGFGQALGQNNSSIVTNGTTTIVQQSSQGIRQGVYQGIAQAGQTLGQFFQNQANDTKPLVRVAAGTPMGLFFVSSVVDQAPGQQPYPFGPLQPGMAGYPNGYGYPGYPGYGFGNAQGTGYNGSMPAGYYPGMGTPGFGGQTASTPSLPYPNAAAPYTGTTPVGAPTPTMPNNIISNTTPNAVPTMYGGNAPTITPIGTPVTTP